MQKRNSMQKQFIQDALRELDHPTAAQVHAHIRQRYPNISLGTVYRNLNALAEEGGVLKLCFPDQPERFDINAWHHAHIHCQSCGRVFDTQSVPREFLQEICADVEASTGFSLRSHSMYFNGICPACQRADTNQMKEDHS